MKKLLCVLTFAILMLFCAPAFAADIPVYIDSVKLEFTDAAPQTVNDRVMVPMRAIFEKLGADVRWDDKTKTATATKGDSVVSLSIDNDIAKLNGADKKLDAPAVSISDRTYVPIRFVSESLGAKVYWNNSSNTVYIYSKDYLADMNSVKLQLLISHKFNNKIRTSLGDIDVINYCKQPKGTAFDYDILSSINQKTVEEIQNNESYTKDQKAQFNEELKQYLNDLANYIIDITSGSYKIVGNFAYIQGYKDAEKKQPIVMVYDSWCNFNTTTKTLDDKGFRWVPELDDYFKNLNQ